MPRRRSNPDQLGLFGTVAAAPPSAPPPRAQPFVDGPLPDEGARARIREDLDTNLLVEAGAGSGKTTALVDRMVALVVSDTASVDRIAAVTFTRKAAAELQQRFQTRLEKAVADARATGDVEEAARLDRALREMHRAFIGTIHSFCARLLRERPVEAGLDPGFEEVLGVEEQRLRRGFWRAHLERLASADDPITAELAAVGIAPSRLEGLFDALVANPDVEFSADPLPPPPPADVAAARARLAALLDRALALMPPEPDSAGWDELQQRVRLLAFLRRVIRWNDDTDFLDLLGEEVVGRSYRVVQKRWPDGRAAKALCEEWGGFRDGAAQELASRWWAHRYPVALRFARRAAEEFEAERGRTGRLTFQDLLMRAARLLREHPGARAELGERYRRVLVDEFQDTDPVQAEVLLLLASEPDGGPWQEATPRPGALFVVGDPKQSIYRFRRADIAVYNLVRDRFEAFGDVVELVANFRSLPPFEGLVEDVFARGGRFGDVATAHQAAFAPLRTRRTDDPGRGRIAQYYLAAEGRGAHAAVARDDAERLAPWIAREVATGRRRPEDFLILARQKAGLATFARALEAWRVPVQVTGAGVDQAEELTELLVLLDALADPSDPVKVVAALVGLFFGLDLDTLLAWSRAEDLGGAEPERPRRFDITSARADGTRVGDALATLGGWWREARTTPADVLVSRIMDEVGLLPLAGSRDLGELRAGSLLFALDTLRVAALHGDTSLPAAVEAVRTALDADEAEAPLEPVRKGAARVMTLHQAKGLEAPVVVLVHPVGRRDHEITMHVERRPDGTAKGHLVVRERQGPWRVRTIARPAGWEEREAEERRFDQAEDDRLLYVAATRARDALLVARRAGEEAKSPWAGLYDWIEANGETLRLDPAAAPEPDALEDTAAELRASVASVAERRARAAAASYLLRTATGLAKAGAAPAPEPAVGPVAAAGAAAPGPHARPDPGEGTDPAFRGVSWGSAVHGALDAAARGARGAALRTVCRALLLETGRTVERGEPTELDELVALVERVLGSEVWARARRAERVLTEVPFAVRLDPHRPLPGEAEPEPGGAAARILEGVVDLAFLEPDGWVLVDYKTDVGTDVGFEERRRRYRRQVDLYAAVWPELTGGTVKERALFFTARTGEDALERW